MRTSLFWYTKDLRIEDLPALAIASTYSEAVVPIYIWDDESLDGEADNRKAFLLDCLADLDREFRKLQSCLIIERGDTLRSLVKLCEMYGCSDVFCTASRDPKTRGLQVNVAKGLANVGVTLHVSGANFLLDPDAIMTKTGSIYRVFTPYRNAALSALKVASSSRSELRVIEANHPLSLPTQKLEISPDRQKGGSTEARKLWTAFKSGGLASYHESRNELANEQGTSKLSAHLNFGTISVHAIMRELMEMSDSSMEVGRTSFTDELLWREFNSYIAHHFPYVLSRAYRKELTFIQWPGTREHLDAWKEGRTGYPIVDAAMRQLKQTGWMHNRARMIVASFLVKDLLINWQEGEAHFMEWLTDGDQIQNNAGWQWAASTGVDAQPYFRIFNPTTQGKRFDAKGEYVRRYVPELYRRTDKAIHELNVQNGADYPMAIVDHASQRERALAMFRNAVIDLRS